MDILFLNLLSESILDLKIHVYAYTCIFRLTTSQSPKLILKADLKWECQYFYFKKIFEAFRPIF